MIQTSSRQAPHRVVPLSNAAFSLVELTLAIGIVAFCLMSLTGLLVVGLQQERASLDRTHAAHLLDSVRNEVRGHLVQGGAALNSSRFGLSIPSPGNTTDGTFVLNAAGQVGDATDANAYVVFYQIDSSPHAFAPDQARVCIAWPGVAEFEKMNDGSLNLQKARGHLWVTLSINRG